MDHCTFIRDSTLRRLSTTAANCIRAVFECRPSDSQNWYSHRDSWSLSTNQLTTADIGNNTDCDCICIQSGADADGCPVSEHRRRKYYRLLIARWFNLWASTTPTCSTTAVITRENSDDNDLDDHVLLWYFMDSTDYLYSGLSGSELGICFFRTNRSAIQDEFLVAFFVVLVMRRLNVADVGSVLRNTLQGSHCGSDWCLLTSLHTGRKSSRPPHHCFLYVAMILV